VMDARGQTKIVARQKDIILGRLQRLPNEVVEYVVAEPPVVLDVAAIGVVGFALRRSSIFVVRNDLALTRAAHVPPYFKDLLAATSVRKFVDFPHDRRKTNVARSCAASSDSGGGEGAA